MTLTKCEACSFEINIILPAAKFMRRHTGKAETIWGQSGKQIFWGRTQYSINLLAVLRLIFNNRMWPLWSR